MKFCKKCGSILIPKNGKLYCPNCKIYYEGKLEVKEKVKKEVKIKEEVKVSMEKVTAVCPKCGNREAYFWIKQTRAPDEAPTRFYKCTKCGYVWREYE